MDFEIYTIGTGKFLEHCLNAIRLLFGGDGFIALMKQISLISLLILLVQYVFNPNIRLLVPWFIQVLLVTSIFIIPNSKVYIIDKLPNEYGLESPARVVDHVPLGLAFIASISSKAGNFITEKFEEAFSSTFPSVKKNNILFGSKIIEDTMNMKPEDSNIKTAYHSFTKYCLYRDLKTGANRANGYTDNELMSSNDLLEFLVNRTSKARRIYYSNEIKVLNISNYTHNNGYISCNSLAHILKESVEKETEARIPRIAKSFYSFFAPYRVPTDYDKIFRNSLQDTYQLFLGSRKSASDIIKQAITINGFKDSVASSFSTVVTDRSTDQYYSSIANLASKSIVFLRGLFEILIYGLFPVAVILVLTPGGYQILKNYFISFIYLQLWMPIYAILFVVFASQYDSLDMGINEITWGNSGKIKSMNREISALAGYMFCFTPFISGLVLRMGLSSLGSLSTSIFGAQQHEAARIASDAARGNYNLGNLNIDNYSYNTMSSNKHNDNFEYFTGTKSFSAPSGSKVSDFVDGTSSMDITSSLSSTGNTLSIDWSSQIGKRVDKNISNAYSDVIRSSSDYIKSTSNSFSKLLGYNKSFLKGSNKYIDFQSALSSEERTSFQAAEKIIDQTSKDFNVSKDDVLRLSIGTNAGVGFNALVAKGGFASGADTSRINNLRAAYDYMISSNHSKEYSNMISTMNAYMKNQGSKDQVGTNQEFFNSIKNDYNQAQLDSLAYHKAKQKYNTHVLQKSEYKDQTQRINENLTPKFIEWIKNRQGSEESEKIFKQKDPGVISNLAFEFIRSNGLNSPINSPNYKSKYHINNPNAIFMGHTFFAENIIDSKINRDDPLLEEEDNLKKSSSSSDEQY